MTVIPSGISPNYSPEQLGYSMHTKPAVLIVSHDGFGDCWPAATYCLKKFWPDCPWKIYTMSNHKPWGDNPLLVGDDKGWSANLVKALDMIFKHTPEEMRFVLTWLDDMLLCRPVNTGYCQTAMNMLVANEMFGGFLLGQGVQPCRPYFHYVWELHKDSDYFISTAPTLWRVGYLKRILENCGESAWDFEAGGTEFARTQQERIWTFFGTDDTLRPIRQYYTAITRGQWNRGCLNWLHDEGFEVADTSRGIIENDRRP